MATYRIINKKRADLTIGAVLLAIPLAVAVIILWYLFLGLVAAGLVSLIFWGLGYDHGLGFIQLWMATSALAMVLSWFAGLFKSRKPSVTVA